MRVLAKNGTVSSANKMTIPGNVTADWVQNGNVDYKVRNHTTDITIEIPTTLKADWTQESTATYDYKLRNTSPTQENIDVVPTVLCHFNGSNNDINTFDSSSNPIVLTRVGTSILSTTQKKFGDTSSYNNGDGGWYTTNATTKLQFNTGDWLIEGWIYPNSLSDKNVFQFGNSDESLMYFTFGINSASDIRIAINHIVVFSSPKVPTINQWNHVAIGRWSGVIYVFINYEFAGSFINTTNINFAQKLALGTNRMWGYFGGSFIGYMDEVRILVGDQASASRFKYSLPAETIQYPFYQRTENWTDWDGGTLTTDGSYNIRTFTSNGTFTVKKTSSIEYLVVGAGGYGGGNGRGGGAGGQVISGTATFTPGEYGISIGVGTIQGWNGNDQIAWTPNVSFIGTSNFIKALGGNTGGDPTGGSLYQHGGAAGSNAGMQNGIISSITGTPTYYAGGGSGGNTGASGGLGGGGAGGSPGGAGTTNTGGGGGGGDNGQGGGLGGSGIVIVRYLP